MSYALREVSSKILQIQNSQIIHIVPFDTGCCFMWLDNLDEKFQELAERISTVFNIAVPSIKSTEDGLRFISLTTKKSHLNCNFYENGICVFAITEPVDLYHFKNKIHCTNSCGFHNNKPELEAYLYFKKCFQRDLIIYRMHGCSELIDRIIACAFEFRKNIPKSTLRKWSNSIPYVFSIYSFSHNGKNSGWQFSIESGYLLDPKKISEISKLVTNIVSQNTDSKKKLLSQEDNIAKTVIQRINLKDSELNSNKWISYASQTKVSASWAAVIVYSQYSAQTPSHYLSVQEIIQHEMRLQAYWLYFDNISHQLSNSKLTHTDLYEIRAYLKIMKTMVENN